MFSKVVFRTGALTPVLKNGIQNRLVVLGSVRSSSQMAKAVDTWEKANQVYYGPERDTTSFPIKKIPETNPPTRLFFIPENFFQMFYEKTGVTGPYVLGAGVLTMLLSKEYWVIEHGFSEFVAFWLAFGILAKKVGPMLSNYLDSTNKEYLQKHWYQPLEATKQQCKDSITQIEKDIWQEEGQKYLFEAKRENVDLQLEAIYRQRLADVQQAVKRRLDYQVEVENTKTNFEQRHMVNWIVDNVVKSITPQQEKESITKCIADLKALGAKA